MKAMTNNTYECKLNIETRRLQTLTALGDSEWPTGHMHFTRKTKVLTGDIERCNRDSKTKSFIEWDFIFIRIQTDLPNQYLSL